MAAAGNRRQVYSQRKWSSGKQGQEKAHRRDWAMGRKEPVNMKAAFALPRRALGRTQLQVSVLGFGTAPLGDLYVQLDDGTAIDTVKRAFELGINLLDTSPHYGNGPVSYTHLTLPTIYSV